MQCTSTRQPKEWNMIQAQHWRDCRITYPFPYVVRKLINLTSGSLSELGLFCLEQYFPHTPWIHDSCPCHPNVWLTIWSRASISSKGKNKHLPEFLLIVLLKLHLSAISRIWGKLLNFSNYQKGIECTAARTDLNLQGSKNHFRWYLFIWSWSAFTGSAERWCCWCVCVWFCTLCSWDGKAGKLLGMNMK